MFSLLRCLLLPSPSIFVACAVEFQVGVLRSRGFFGVKSSPARIDNSAFLSLLFLFAEKWLEIHHIVLQTMKRQLFKSALVINGNSKLLSVECCLETKMRRDVNLLYDVMADTIGYIQVKMRAASWQLAKTHAQFTHCECASRATR